MSVEEILLDIVTLSISSEYLDFYSGDIYVFQFYYYQTLQCSTSIHDKDIGTIYLIQHWIIIHFILVQYI